MYERIPFLPVTPAPNAPDYVVERDHVHADSYRFRFTVVGRGLFPFDMLRYEGCFPADTLSALRMDKGETRDERKASREVVLEVSTANSRYLPCFDRWRSFGWVVKSDA